MLARLALSLLLLSAVKESVSLTDQPGVVWYETDGERLPLFIPVQVLQRAAFDPDRLPIRPEFRSQLAAKLTRADERRRGLASPDTPSCDSVIFGSLPPGVNDRFPPGHRLDAIEGSPVSFLGTVVAVNPGLLVQSAQTATLVEVRVEQRFRGDSYEAGQTLSYLQETGSFESPSGELCTADKNLYGAKIGDQLIVAGSIDESNPGHIKSGRYLVFPVIGDKVMPPLGGAGSEQSLPLAAIRSRSPVRNHEIATSDSPPRCSCLGLRRAIRDRCMPGRCHTALSARDSYQYVAVGQLPQQRGNSARHGLLEQRRLW